MRCEELVDVIAAAADGSPLEDRRHRRHVESCLRCQAELVQYRKLLRALHALRTEVLEPAPGVLADVMLRLEEAGEQHALRAALAGRRAAYVGGIAAATAGAAGAWVLVARTRRRVRLAS